MMTERTADAKDENEVEGHFIKDPEVEGHWVRKHGAKPEDQPGAGEADTEGHGVTPPPTAMQREEPEVEGHIVNIRRPIIRD